MSLQFEYYHSRESEQFAYFRIPKALFTESMFQNLTTYAKLLYGLMLDRIGLSVRSGWVDEEDRVYIYYSLTDIMAHLGCGHNKAISLLKELDQDFGLIRRQKQGLGRPDRIYVMNFTTGDQPQTSDNGNSGEMDTANGNDFRVRKEEVWESDFRNQDLQTSEKRNSGHPEIGSQEFLKSERSNNNINNNYKNNTEPINPFLTAAAEEEDPVDRIDGFGNKQYEQLLRGLWGCYSLLDRHSQSEVEGIISLGADVLASTQETIRIGGRDIPRKSVAERLKALSSDHINYVLECVHKATWPIKNIRAYLLTALYNAPMTIDAYYANQVAQDEKRRWGTRPRNYDCEPGASL